jgi:hypothetical protein
MAESLLNHPQADEWFPWFGERIDAGRDVPPERGAELVLKLASGRYDALSGSFLYIEDELDQLVSRAEEIRRLHLYTLALKKVQ